MWLLEDFPVLAVLTVLIILVILGIYVTSQIEPFETHFINIIKSDENLKARGFSTIQDLLWSYQQSRIDPSPSQLDKIQRCLSMIRGKTLIDLNQISITLVDNYVESSFPFTINHTIILPQRVLQKSDHMLATILFHETLHIFQRYHQNLCNDLYINYWDFKPVDIRLPAIARNNPDLGATYYSWHGYVPLVTIHGQSLKGRYYYLKARDGYQTLHEDLPPKYRSYFKGVSKLEHPNEIMAEMLTQIIMKHMTYNTVSAQQLLKWYHNLLRY